jgi:hypothetical protein
MKTLFNSALLLSFLFLSPLVMAETGSCEADLRTIDEEQLGSLIAVTDRYLEDEVTEEIVIELSFEGLEDLGALREANPSFGLESFMASSAEHPFGQIRLDMGLGSQQSLFETYERSREFQRRTTQRREEQEWQEQQEQLVDAASRVSIIVKSRDHIAHDKFLHFAVGAGISEVTRHSVRGYLPEGAEGDRMAAVIAFGVTTAIGIAKEVRDMQGFGTPEVADAVWTSAGSGLTLMRLRYRF